MKRRICLVGIALGVCPLALMAGNATAASTKSKSPTTSVHKIACSTKTSILVPLGQSSVLPPVAQGQDYGPAQCKGPLHDGVESDSFNVPASGDTLAKFTMYFRTGTLHGSYDLTPQPAAGLTNFLQTNWTGTMKILGGTGAFSGTKGTGTMACFTLEGVHVSCTDKLKLKLKSA